MAETDSPGTGPPALPRAPFEQVDDFPDRLSPMLVKELRQGLRTQTFVILFLALQSILALVLLTAGPIAAAENSASGAAGGVVSKIVFCIYALGILVVQPLRGISAVANEIRQNTIDLMVLTRLSAWRIVWGKWCSIMAQSSLILLAILPYLILRYFFGGMQLFAELALMLYLFVVSGALTALTVGLSAVASVLIRGLVVVGGAAMLTIWIPFGFTPELAFYVDALSFSRSAETLGALGLLALAVYLGYFFLEVGATAIAPAAENRATRKRFVGLLVVILSYLLLQFINSEVALYAALIVAAFISLDLFTENSDFPAVVCKPFLRWGIIGRLAGRLLYPGWASGALFFAFLMLVITALVALNAPQGVTGSKQFITAASGFGVMIFPAAMIQLFARRSPNRFTIYVSLWIMSFLLAVILASLFKVVKDKVLLWVFTPVPMVLFPVSKEVATTTNQDTLLFLSWGIAGVYFLIVLAGALPQLGRIAKLEDEAPEEFEDAEEP